MFVLFSGSQDAVGEIGLIDCIREILCLQTESTVLAVRNAQFALERAVVQEVSKRRATKERRTYPDMVVAIDGDALSAVAAMAESAQDGAVGSQLANLVKVL